MSKPSMTSSRPYLVRALYDWIVDNNLTPYLMVNARAEGVSVPQQYVNKDGQIILNVAPRAVSAMQLGNQAIEFSARFGGIPTDLYIPVHSVMGVYARENGQGMMFDPETSPTEPDPTPSPGNSPSQDKRPSLRIVK